MNSHHERHDDQYIGKVWVSGNLLVDIPLVHGNVSHLFGASRLQVRNQTFYDHFELYTVLTEHDQSIARPVTPDPTSNVKSRGCGKCECKEKEQTLEDRSHSTARKYLSPRASRTPPRKVNDHDVDFLSKQQMMREQRAKTERLARIQRRMCTEEKRILERSKSGNKQDMRLKGRKKKVRSPLPRKTRRRLLFEEMDDSDDNEEENESEEEKTSALDDETKNLDEIKVTKINEGVQVDTELKVDTNDTTFSSKSIQTQPEVLTPKMNRIETQRLKNCIMGMEDTKQVQSPKFDSNQIFKVLPPDIMRSLKELEEKGALKDMNDFNQHFKEILESHDDSKQIASSLLQCMVKLRDKKQESERREMASPRSLDRPPIPSPRIMATTSAFIDNDETPSLDGNENVDVNGLDANEVEEEQVEEEQVEHESHDKEQRDDTVENEEQKASVLERECTPEFPEPDTISPEMDCGTAVETVDSVMEMKSEDDRTQRDDDSMIIANWIKQHDSFFAPSNDSDADIIRQFVDGEPIRMENINPPSPVVVQQEEEPSSIVLAENSSPRTSIYLQEIMSLHEDIEVLSLIESCKRLRADISRL